MDCNKFDFDALLRSSEFNMYESYETKSALNELHMLIDKYINNEKAVDEINAVANDYARSSFDDAFKQGFCFAVNIIKFMLKI